MGAFVGSILASFWEHRGSILGDSKEHKAGDPRSQQPAAEEVFSSPLRLTYCWYRPAGTVQQAAAAAAVVAQRFFCLGRGIFLSQFLAFYTAVLVYNVRVRDIPNTFLWPPPPLLYQVYAMLLGRKKTFCFCGRKYSALFGEYFICPFS